MSEPVIIRTVTGTMSQLAFRHTQNEPLAREFESRIDELLHEFSERGMAGEDCTLMLALSLASLTSALLDPNCSGADPAQASALIGEMARHVNCNTCLLDLAGRVALSAAIGVSH